MGAGECYTQLFPIRMINNFVFLLMLINTNNKKFKIDVLTLRHQLLKEVHLNL